MSIPIIASNVGHIISLHLSFLVHIEIMSEGAECCWWSFCLIVSRVENRSPSLKWGGKVLQGSEQKLRSTVQVSYEIHDFFSWWMFPSLLNCMQSSALWVLANGATGSSFITYIQSFIQRILCFNINILSFCLHIFWVSLYIFRLRLGLVLGWGWGDRVRIRVWAQNLDK